MWLWGKFGESGQHILFSQLGVNSILGGFLRGYVRGSTFLIVCSGYGSFQQDVSKSGVRGLFEWFLC